MSVAIMIIKTCEWGIGFRLKGVEAAIDNYAREVISRTTDEVDFWIRVW